MKSSKLTCNEKRFLRLIKTMSYKAQFSTGITLSNDHLFLKFVSKNEDLTLVEYVLELACEDYYRGLRTGKYYSWKDLDIY